MQKIIFRGQVYHSLDEMPAEARQEYLSAMAALDAGLAKSTEPPRRPPAARRWLLLLLALAVLAALLALMLIPH